MAPNRSKLKAESTCPLEPLTEPRHDLSLNIQRSSALMNKSAFALFLFLFLSFSTPAFAQSVTPQWEIFGGANWLRAGISPNLQQFGVAHVNLVGWDGSATENVNSWFGGTIDFSGSYGRPTVTV